MGPITAIIPVPRKAELGARTFQVGELRLLDLAELQACLDELEPHPLDEVLPKLDGADDETRRQLLTDAYDRIQKGPPLVWDDRGSEWLTTVEGLATLLLIGLRRFNTITPAECVQLANEITWPQYLKLRRLLFGFRPLKTVERMLGLSAKSKRGSPSITWTESIVETAGLLKVPLREVYLLTLTEYSAVRTGGKPPEDEEGIPVADDADLESLQREQFRRFYGREMTEEDVI